MIRDDEKCTASYDLSGGNWRRLKATIGIEIDPKAPGSTPRKTTQRSFSWSAATARYCTSPRAFATDSRPVSIDVDVSGVNKLELEVTGQWLNFVSSVDWADIRLEK